MAKMLSDGKIELRSLEPTDLDNLYEWESEMAAWMTSNTVAPYSRHVLWEYLQAYDGDIYKMKEVRMMITADGEAVGMLDLFNLDVKNRRVEVGIFVDEKHRNGGVGASALEVAKRYAFGVVGVHQVYATVAADNHVAIKTFESAGFGYKTMLKDWLTRGGSSAVDAWLMQCIDD